MAEVFRARRKGAEGFQKTVVVKTILPAYVENRSFVDMLIQEATVCASLLHSNIVQVYDLGIDNDQPFIAMEYVDGLDLLQLLKHCSRQGTRVPLGLVLHICSEVAKALDYAHHARNSEGQTLNIIHRDVSPSNVLLSREGEVKITDFGVARFSIERGPVTRAGVLKGKMGYMSPEQVKGGLFDGRADLFALGVILFEALTLKRLFLGASELETLINISDVKVEDRLKKHHQAIEPVLPLLRKALSKSPEERFQRGLEFHRALQDLIHGLRLRVDSTDVAAFVRETLDEVMATPESAERYKRDQLTDQELQEEVTGKAETLEYAIPLDGTEHSVPGVESAPEITQVEIPRELNEARSTGQHRAAQLPPGAEPSKGIRISENWTPVTHNAMVPAWISRLVHHRETGVLHLRNGEEQLRIFLAGGVVRTLNRVDGLHPLQAHLYGEEILAENTWIEIEKASSEGGMRLVDAVIQYGSVDPADVIRHLQKAYEASFMETFRWVEGEIRFESGGRIQNESRVPVELDAAELLTAGVFHGLQEDGLNQWLKAQWGKTPVFEPVPRLRHLGHREKMLETALREGSGKLETRVGTRSRADRSTMACLLLISEACGLLHFQGSSSEE